MRKTILLLCGVGLLSHTSIYAQQKRQCGFDLARKALTQANPEFGTHLQEVKNNLQTQAENYVKGKDAAAKTTATNPIPVIFHICVTSAQLTALGGEAGVKKRVDSQILVLNRDYNRGNLDSVLIPSSWKPLYGNAGIRFGLAHTSPTGTYTPGYEIRVTTASFSIGDGDYASVKSSSTGGLDPWDNTKYLNVWCLNFTDNPSLLGIATPPAFTGGWGGLPASSKGVCITYNALGKRSSATESYAGGGVYDRGRTLTHEIGHYFELWHTWGDDDGACPWDGGNDDGITDTPPESDATYGNPAYTIAGGTLNDACQFQGSTNRQPIGIPSLVFMDYTDDKAMYMFTTMQAAAAASNVLPATSESYSLTQNPSLLNPPTGISSIEHEAELNIWPNPTSGVLSISYNTTTKLESVIISNTLGQVVSQSNDENQLGNGNYSVNLSSLSSGIYVVTCNFASGSVTRKIVLQ